MRPSWAVVWRGKNCVTYLDKDGGWSLDPDEARVFRTWAHARVSAGVTKGISVVRCWT